MTPQHPASTPPIIDCHVHVFDPARFPYEPDTWYRPTGAEIGTAEQLGHVLDAHGVAHALIVGPNSGYGLDNRCLLDALHQGQGRYKGIAVVRNDASLAELQDLQAAGVVGIAMNVALLGVDFYRQTQPLLERLRDLGMWAQVQVQNDELVALAKFSATSFPHADAWPYVHALLEAYTPEALVWASDWPFLRAPARIDYGPLLTLLEQWLPNAADRQAVLWDTPRRLFGFGV